MIRFDKLWETMEKKGVTTYQLRENAALTARRSVICAQMTIWIPKHGINSAPFWNVIWRISQSISRINKCFALCNQYFNVSERRYGGFDDCMDKLIITPKEDKSVTMTIRMDRKLYDEYNALSVKTNRSRNELINIALRYALDNMELAEEKRAQTE